MLLTPYLGSVCNAACACQEGTPTKISCDLSWPPVPINGNLNVMSIAVHSQSLSKSFPCINHHMANLQNQNIIESARAGRCKKNRVFLEVVTRSILAGGVRFLCK